MIIIQLSSFSPRFIASLQYMPLRAQTHFERAVLGPGGISHHCSKPKSTVPSSHKSLP